MEPFTKYQERGWPLTESGLPSSTEISIASFRVDLNKQGFTQNASNRPCNRFPVLLTNPICNLHIKVASLPLFKNQPMKLKYSNSLPSKKSLRTKKQVLPTGMEPDAQLMVKTEQNN